MAWPPLFRARPPRARPRPGVERVVRVSSHQSYEFLINHSAEDR